MNDTQSKALVKANAVLKEAWPNDNLQICLNLSKDRDNVNFNIKQSGIMSPAKKS